MNIKCYGCNKKIGEIEQGTSIFDRNLTDLFFIEYHELYCKKCTLKKQPDINLPRYKRSIKEVDFEEMKCPSCGKNKFIIDGPNAKSYCESCKFYVTLNEAIFTLWYWRVMKEEWHEENLRKILINSNTYI